METNTATPRSVDPKEQEGLTLFKRLSDTLRALPRSTEVEAIIDRFEDVYQRYNGWVNRYDQTHYDQDSRGGSREKTA